MAVCLWALQRADHRLKRWKGFSKGLSTVMTHVCCCKSVFLAQHAPADLCKVCCQLLAGSKCELDMLVAALATTISQGWAQQWLVCCKVWYVFAMGFSQLALPTISKHCSSWALPGVAELNVQALTDAAWSMVCTSDVHAAAITQHER